MKFVACMILAGLAWLGALVFLGHLVSALTA